MSNEFLDYIEDILDAISKIEQLIDGFSYEQFESDFRTHFAVTRALEIVGEAVKRLPMDVRQRYPDIPWKGMTGMRDRIIHGYGTVDLQSIWRVVQNDLPTLKPQIQTVLDDYID